MKRWGGLVLTALVIGGCQSKPPKLLKQEAGNWTALFTLDAFEVPNPPANYRGDLERALAVRSSAPVCVTPEQVAKTDLASQLIEGQGLTDCDYDENITENGLMTVDAVCNDPRGRAVQLNINGAANSKSADVTIRMVGEEQAEVPISLQLRAVLNHTGPCLPQPIEVPQSAIATQPVAPPPPGN